MSGLAPKLEILPDGQRQIWTRLDATPDHFVLYGGTALALRLGHRESVDFDFFSRRSFEPLELARSVPYLNDQIITQQGENTLSCDISTQAGPVKISFFGALSLGQIEPPDLVANNNVAIASLRDLMGTKCATIPQRAEMKDYLDIDGLISSAGINLLAHLIHRRAVARGARSCGLVAFRDREHRKRTRLYGEDARLSETPRDAGPGDSAVGTVVNKVGSEGLACAKAIYGQQYNPMLTLQALSYFDDLHESLAPDVQSRLLAAVKSVSLQNLPETTASRKIGDGVQRENS